MVELRIVVLYYGLKGSMHDVFWWGDVSLPPVANQQIRVGSDLARVQEWI